MNAFNTVNLAAACIVTSTEHAKKLGIPESRWIYPFSGAGDKDADRCKSASMCTQLKLTVVVWDRPDFHSSPAISWTLDQSLKTSGLSKDEIDLYDFYSYV